MLSIPERQTRERNAGGVEKGRARRSRVGRACDTCRHKRVKCDGHQPACIPCTNYGIRCTYLERPKHKSKFFKSRSPTSVGGRLARVEELLNATIAPSVAISRDINRGELGLRDRSIEVSESWIDQPSEASHGLSGPNYPSQNDDQSGFQDRHLNGTEGRQLLNDECSASARQRLDSNRNGQGSLVVNDQGDLQYLGPSSGFAVLTQATGLLKNGNAIHQQLHMSEFVDSGKETAGDISLPPKDIANKYIEAYFANSPFPLFHRRNFQKRANLMYTDHPPAEKCFRASWSMILAFGSHYTASRPTMPLDETEGWKYFTAAHDILPDLLQGSNLSALQALLLIVQYLQFTSRASRWMLMGACAQMAQALGLHRDSHTLRLEPAAREERIKVFWVCYVMDKTISMGVGRSSALHDFDCDAPLPSSHSDYSNDSEIEPLAGLFDWHHAIFLDNIRLSQITSKVYRKLYSAQSVARHTIDSLADAVGDLDEELMSWRNKIPAQYRPEHDIVWKADVLHRHVLQIHLGYYNCLYNIHRAVFISPFGPTSYITPDRPLNLLRRNRIYGSAALAIGAARACLRLCLTLAEKFEGLIDMRIWLVVYYPFSAIIALFIAIVRNPRQPSAKTDLQLIAAATQLFDKIYVRSDLLRKMNALARRFQTEAANALGRLNKTNQEKETIEVIVAAGSGNTSNPRNLNEGNAIYAELDSIPDRYGSSGNSSQHQQDSVTSFAWPNLNYSQADIDTGVGIGENMNLFPPSSSSTLQDEVQEPTHISILQGTDAPDIWQAPLGFEWGQWEAYIEKFPGESLDFNRT